MAFPFKETLAFSPLSLADLFTWYFHLCTWTSIKEMMWQIYKNRYRSSPKDLIIQETHGRWREGTFKYPRIRKSGMGWCKGKKNAVTLWIYTGKCSIHLKQEQKAITSRLRLLTWWGNFLCLKELILRDHSLWNRPL